MQICKIQQRFGAKPVHFSQFVLNLKTIRQNE